MQEADALGTPAVAYDVSCLRDAVRDGKIGWLVPAAWRHGDLDDVERRLRKELRLTDMITRGLAGLTVLLTGCDEVGAASTLRRAHVSPDTLRLATTTQVLCGTGEGDQGW